MTSLSRYNTILMCIYGVILLLMETDHVQGDVNCVCTTRACKQRQKRTCQGRYMCYAQSIAASIADIGLDIVRGCIDDRTPLLCENKIPKDVTGAWPVLHCCKDDWCNQHVVPQIPQWLLDREDKKREPKPTTPEPTYQYDAHASLSNIKNNPYVEDIYMRKPADSRQYSSAGEINPIYIGIPIAGACILLASVIFAIFLLRRKSSPRPLPGSPRTNYYTGGGSYRLPGSSPETTTAPSNACYHSNAADATTHCCVSHSNDSTVTDDRKYALGREGSSATSERKLLMKV
ncbi:uncharacterized protein LOC141912104 [Tubulanus polymorphus]|uniref:uncharacterized protein LOC141912104 n=1 Tax=Tubulanus polymorphus TaxID=672921 RepID=UPI003DA4EF08